MGGCKFAYIRANAYNWLYCCVRVRVSAHSSLTTATCHYRPWLVFTGASWPVEVHLGGCSHLSGPGLGLKLIYRPLIWCRLLIVPGRLLISKLYNVFTLNESACKNALTSSSNSYIMVDWQHVILRGAQNHRLGHESVCVDVFGWAMADKHHYVLSARMTVMVFEHRWFQELMLTECDVHDRFYTQTYRMQNYEKKSNPDVGNFSPS